MFEALTAKYQTLYHFDAVWISSKMTKGYLYQFLPLDELRKHCRSIHIEEIPPEAQNFGFKSYIKVVNPTLYCVEFLVKNEHRILKGNRIFYMEIAMEIVIGDKFSAADGLNRGLTTTLHRKHCRDVKRIDSLTWMFAPDRNAADSAVKQGYLAGLSKRLRPSLTTYFGKKNSEMVVAMYSSESKLESGMFAVRVEFRIKGSGNVNKRTGAMDVRELHYLMSTMSMEDIFHSFAHSQLAMLEIELTKLGKWVLKYDSQKKLTRDEEGRCVGAAVQFIQAHDIRSWGDLDRLVKEQKWLPNAHRFRVEM